MNGQTNDGSGPTPVIIQRLLIFHPKLAEICNGSALSEDASNEELLEQVLYYYHSSHLGNSHSFIEFDDATAKDVLQFCGLCSALLQLPQAIHSTGSDGTEKTDDEEKNDPIRCVHLDESFLVFCSLEGRDFFAVAQAQRATPSAVRDAIERAHLFFGMLRGGGIHRRLQQHIGEDLVSTGHDPCIYPGMDELYRLRKRLRCSVRTARKTNYSNVPTNKESEHDKIRAAITNLCSRLPITAIRKELRVHYDAAIGELNDSNLVRNIIQGIPTPLPLASGEHLYEAPLRTLMPSGRKQLERIVNELVSPCKEGPRVLGVACFLPNQLLFPARFSFEGTLSSAATGALMWHMTHIRYQMLPHCRDVSGSTTSSPQSSFAMSSFADMDDRVAFSPNRTGFLEPPPLSMLSSLEEWSNAFAGPPARGVWAPPVCLPLQTPDADGNPSYFDARMCLYTRGELSFLVFLSYEQDDTSYCDVFRRFEQAVVDTINVGELSNDESASAMILSADCIKEDILNVRGQEMIYIDRMNHVVTLNVDPRLDEEASQKRKAKTCRNSQFSRPSEITSGRDCRFRLASRLSLDSILAFEDAFDEARRFKASTKSLTNSFEMCTLLKKRWVYAFIQGDRELYALFDSAFFVTVADVQKAAQKIWKDLKST